MREATEGAELNGARGGENEPNDRHRPCEDLPEQARNELERQQAKQREERERDRFGATGGGTTTKRHIIGGV